MSDPTAQPPAWNPDNEPTRAYPVPPAQPPSQPQYYGQPPQHSGQPPYYDRPPTQPQYYGQPPMQPPHNGQEPGYDLPPPRKNKMGWLIAGAIAVVVSLIGGVGAFVLTRSDQNASAESPLPTATYSDGLSSPDPSTQPSATPTDTPTTVPTPTPTPSPTPTERRRTLKDVDQGIKVYDDVYVKPATGWRKDRSTQYSVTLGSRSRAGAVFVMVNPVGYPARVAVAAVAADLIKADRLTGVRKSSVKTLSPANSNIDNQAQLTYSGRYTTPSGGVLSLVAKCTTMTGVESIHNVTVTLCVAARKDDQTAVFRDATRMLASVAKSI
ncbi:hypothetical protein ACIBL3_06750 [Kribbella sp. NPDC050124]|uniref:hypothetical protein n=1 Tax=Kribbella sp. NPDC050124 TaxID=3364114 RepID=UPI0037A36FE7